MALSEVERRQQYLDKMSGEGEVLRPLVEECLDDGKRIQDLICSKESQQHQHNITMLHQKIEKMRDEIKEQKAENAQLHTTIKQIENHSKVFGTTVILW